MKNTCDARPALTLPYSPRTFAPMNDGKPTGPRVSPEGHQARAEREARRAEALRTNLRRRKEQARARDGERGHASGKDRDAAPAGLETPRPIK